MHVCVCRAHVRPRRARGGACSHAYVRRGRRLPHGLWIMHACAPHTHACTQHTHMHGMLTHAHSCCMLVTRTRTCTCTGEAPAGWVPHGLWIMHACAPHMYTHTHTHAHTHTRTHAHPHTRTHTRTHAHTHTHTHTTYACAWHARTCTFLLHAHHTHAITHTHVCMHTCVTHPETTQHVGAACIST